MENEKSHTKEMFLLQAPARWTLACINNSLTLSRRGEQIEKCQVNLLMPFHFYSRIEEENLFHLDAEIRGVLHGGELLPDKDIQIEAVLQPSLLPRLLEHASNAQEAAVHLHELSRRHLAAEPELPDNVVAISSRKKRLAAQDIDPLLCTESWFCLSVKQTQDAGEVGYRTFWSYVALAALTNPETSSDALGEALIEFLKDWTRANLSESVKGAFSDLAQNIDTFFEGSATPSTPDHGETTAILESIMDFLDDCGWPYLKIKGEPALRLYFRGHNGQWFCHAMAREEQKQFLFYSLCPIKVPEDKRYTVAELITRANHGVIIGNFELDFSDGDIRYKTSIDIEGDRLSPALIKQLIYSNVMMMDVYLPAILAVITDGLTPEEAIARSESR